MGRTKKRGISEKDGGTENGEEKLERIRKRRAKGNLYKALVLAQNSPTVHTSYPPYQNIVLLLIVLLLIVL